MRFFFFVIKILLINEMFKIQIDINHKSYFYLIFYLINHKSYFL